MTEARRALELLSGSARGHTLPQPFYRDAALFELDMTAVLNRSWMMVGFECELPAAAGSYLALTIGPHPLLLIRGRDGHIRGFHNVCRHRGSPICVDGQGRCSKLICPYHKWTYDIDGRLIGAARMPDDFTQGTHNLRPIRVEALAGCLYVSLGDDGADFAPFRSAAAPALIPYRLADAKLAFASTLIEKANWKLVMENARECYHCATSHPDLKLSYQIAYGNAVVGEMREFNRRFAQKMERLGLSTAASEGDWWHVERYPLNPGMESISADGAPVVTRRLIELDETELGGLWWATQPNSFCHALADYAFMFSVIPVGPQETRVVSKWLVHAQAVEGVDYTVEGLTDTWTRTNLQDRDLVETNQRGVNSSGYVPGPYSLDEDYVVRFGNWYRDLIQAIAVGEGAS